MTKRRKPDVRMTWQELIELWKLLNWEWMVIEAKVKEDE